MATVKLSFDKRRSYQDGRYPVVLRLTSNSLSTNINTGVKLLEKEWDEQKNKVTRTHPDHSSLNLLLKNRLLDLEKKLLELNGSSTQLQLSELKNLLLSNKKAVTFRDFAAGEIQLMRDQERFGNAGVYLAATNKLLKFTGENLLIDQITYSMIVNFDAYLIKSGICRNTVAVHMRELRALVNKAIHKGLLDRNKYPFAGYKIRTERTVSRAIGIPDMQKLLQEPLQHGTPMWHSRNIFFLIFNLIGISFVDLALLAEDNMQNGRIVYRRRKTGKMYSIKITPEAQRIFDLYKSPNSNFLLPICKLEGVEKKNEIKAIHLKLHVCNEHLKKLGKRCGIPLPCTSYIARYSWAQIAKSLGYSKDLIAESLGHEYGNRTTGIYLENYGDAVLDKVNEAVTNSINAFKP